MKKLTKKELRMINNIGVPIVMFCFIVGSKTLGIITLGIGFWYVCNELIEKHIR